MMAHQTNAPHVARKPHATEAARPDWGVRQFIKGLTDYNKRIFLMSRQAGEAETEQVEEGLSESNLNQQFEFNRRVQR